MEMRHLREKEEREYEEAHPGSTMPKKRSYVDKYIEEFLPPPEPE